MPYFSLLASMIGEKKNALLSLDIDPKSFAAQGWMFFAFLCFDAGSAKPINICFNVSRDKVRLRFV